MDFHAGEGARKILMLAIAAASVLLAALIGLLAGLFTPWILLALIPISAAGVFLFLWYPPRFAASMEGSFDGEAVRARMGVLWKREVFIPMNALRTFVSNIKNFKRMRQKRSLTSLPGSPTSRLPT